MDPNASSWTPSAAAPAFTPGGGSSSEPPPATPANHTPRTESISSDIDENDPLWQAVLNVAEGNRKKAESMLSNEFNGLKVQRLG